MTSIVCHHGLVNDNDDADDLFPAYTAYIHGVDTQREESINFDALLYANSTRPIYYTNSMPSRSRPCGPSRNAPQHHSAPQQWNTNLDLESCSSLADGPSVLDLRLPSLHPDAVRLIPPQSVHIAPPSFLFHGLAPQMATAPVSSAEMTRRKLLNASQRPNILALPAQASSQQFLYSRRQQDRSDSYPDQRHMPAYQATHPSLLRSSSATDVDSQLGRRPPSRPLTPLPLISPNLSDGQLSLPLARSQQGPLPSHPTVPLNLPSFFIRPGELLANPCYAAIPKPYRQQMDAQFIQLWSAAQQRLDHKAKSKALEQIRTSTAYVYEVLREMQQLAQRPAQVNTQSSTAQSPHTECRYAHPPALPDEQEHKVQDLQSQQQAPSQQLEHRSHDSQYPQDTQWVQTNQAYHVSHVSQFPPLSQTPPPIPANLHAYIDAQIPVFLAATRVINTPVMDTDGQAQQAKAQAWQNHFLVTLPPEGQEYLQQTIGKMSAQQQNPAHHDVSPTQVQVVNIAPSLRAWIDANLPKFFDAIRCSNDRTQNRLAQQKSKELQTQFKASLSPEGHAYVEEIAK